MSRVLPIVAVSLVLSACPMSDSPAPRAESRETPTRETPSPSGLEYECSRGFPFDPLAIVPEDGSETRTDPRWTAAERVLTYSDTGSFPSSGWVEVPSIFSPSSIAFVARREDNFFEIRLDRRDGEWEPSGWSGCQPRVAVLWANVVEWALRRGEDPAPSDRKLEVVLHERECVSGRDPRPHLIEPDVIYEEEQVLIVMTAEIKPGRGYECPGNPIVNHTIKLDEPIDDRQLFDAGYYPPRSATRRLPD